MKKFPKTKDWSAKEREIIFHEHSNRINKLEKHILILKAVLERRGISVGAGK
ncbi:MAG: hypothetical protein AAB507_01725 [Patescibacteria group bacterium]